MALYILPLSFAVAVILGLPVFQQIAICLIHGQRPLIIEFLATLIFIMGVVLVMTPGLVIPHELVTWQYNLEYF